MKNIIAASILIAAIVLPQSAIAQTATRRNLDVTLTFEGAPNSPFSAAVWTAKRRNVTVNPCGLAIVPTGDSPMQFVQIVGGAEVFYSALPIQNLVTCSGGVLSEPRPANFKLPDGKTVLVNQTPGASLSVEFFGRSARAGTFNACGMRAITIKNTDAVGADSIQVDFAGQSQSLGDLNYTEHPPICRKVGGNSIKYIRLN